MDWTALSARRLAADHLAGLGARWDHVQAVGNAADKLARDGHLGDEVACAAWLHDIGYAPSVAATGFHPVDGARFLRGEGAPAAVVSLVAHHTGASFEAEERGLGAELAVFDPPSEPALDAITLLDMTNGPDGARVEPAERVAEILRRYAPGSPVHRAVSRSRGELLAACDRARARLNLTGQQGR